jgi:hypothetical protein
MRTVRGQAIVEFALVVPVFLLFLFGTFDVARAYVAYTAAASCAREAARSGAMYVGQQGWDTLAKQACLNLAVGIDPQALSISVAQTTIDASLLPWVRADVTYTFHSITPGIATLLGDPIQFRASTVVLAG